MPCQFVQAFHVEEDESLGDAEVTTQCMSGRFVERSERLANSRVRHRHPWPIETQLLRAFEQPAAVEGHARGTAVRLRKAIDRTTRPVVPNFSAVQREHVR